MSYTESEKDRLSKKLKSVEEDLRRTESRLASEKAQRKFAEHRVRAEKGAKTKLKNRIANGVCPCCTRSFQNLQRHIETKHPEFKGS